MKKVFQFAVGVIMGFFVVSTSLAADVYTIDSVHSQIGFAAKHLMVSTVKGSFSDYTGTIQFDVADPLVISAEATIQVGSINTQNEKRDGHLKSPDFFDAANFPTITFKSTSVTKSGDNYTITGDLTMHGVTKSISIPCTIAGPIKGMQGDDVIGLSGQMTINRQDFGVSWNKALDAGGYVVSDDVTITVDIEAYHQKEVKQEAAK